MHVGSCPIRGGAFDARNDIVHAVRISKDWRSDDTELAPFSRQSPASEIPNNPIIARKNGHGTVVHAVVSDAHAYSGAFDA